MFSGGWIDFSNIARILNALDFDFDFYFTIHDNHGASLMCYMKQVAKSLSNYLFTTVTA